MDQQPKSKQRRRARRIARRQARRSRADQFVMQLQQRNLTVLAIIAAVIIALARLVLIRLATRRPPGLVAENAFKQRRHTRQIAKRKIRKKRTAEFVVQLRRRRVLAVLVVVVAVTLAGSLIRLTAWRLAVPTETSEAAKLVYNVKTPPRFKQSQKLQAIVDELVSLAADRGLPPRSLSITLLDVKSSESAGYQQDQLRYPASVVKLFWMVAAYAYLEKGIVPEEALAEDIYEMVQHSSNQAASRILDQVTETESGPELQSEEYQVWLKKRQQVSKFFHSADYQEINLSQKTFPIAYLNLDEPKGRDLQLRGETSQPNRNQITTAHAARLMYEIVTGQAVSPKASQKMTQLLSRDLRPEAWKTEEANSWGFNPIKGFLGESLPADVQFASKAGWTSTCRAEVAFVATSNGETIYILAILADDSAYSDDWKIFPKMSRYVFKQMTRKS